MPFNPDKPNHLERTQADIRSKKVERRVVDMLREIVLKNDIEQENLPDIIDIDAEIIPNPEYPEDEGTIRDALEQMNRLGKTTGYEFGQNVVMNYKGQVIMGPLCCDQDTHSVRIDAPLGEHEYELPSGLIAVRHDTAPIVMHCHPGNEPFSLQDIFVHFGRDCKQMYVIRDNGEIDMLQWTKESHLMSEELLTRLLSIWDSYLTPDGYIRPDLNEEEQHAFIERIATSPLSLGFYSNRNSNNPGKLEKM